MQAPIDAADFGIAVMLNTTDEDLLACLLEMTSEFPKIT